MLNLHPWPPPSSSLSTASPGFRESRRCLCPPPPGHCPWNRSPSYVRALGLTHVLPILVDPHPIWLTCGLWLDVWPWRPAVHILYSDSLTSVTPTLSLSLCTSDPTSTSSEAHVCFWVSPGLEPADQSLREGQGGKRSWCWCAPACHPPTPSKPTTKDFCETSRDYVLLPRVWWKIQRWPWSYSTVWFQQVTGSSWVSASSIQGDDGRPRLRRQAWATWPQQTSCEGDDSV